MVQDLRFDQVVRSMSHHPIHRNTIIPKADTKDTKGFGVSNGVMRAGVFHVSFFVEDFLCRGKLFGITRPSQYNTFSQWYTYTYLRCFNHARFYPEVYRRLTSVNVAIISDFHLDGIHSCIFNGPHRNSHHQINESCSFPLVSRGTGSIVSLELRMNADGTDGSFMLLYPDHDPLLTAKELSGEYVWFAPSDNRDTPDFMDHDCDIIILECE